MWIEKIRKYSESMARFFFEVGNFSLKVRLLLRVRKSERFLDLGSNNAFQRCKINPGSISYQIYMGKKKPLSF